MSQTNGTVSISAPINITPAIPNRHSDVVINNDTSGVRAALAKFDNDFSTMLATLDTVWNGPAETSWKTLGAAVQGMVDFRVLSCYLIMSPEGPESTGIPASIISNLAT